MKYITPFRDGKLAQQISEQIAQEAKPEHEYRLMEFCGGHTHTIFRYGITDLLPDNVRMLHGPGCPVCVLPMKRIDAAIDIALQANTILCSYGDMLRVPGAEARSLLKAKAQGADIRMIYSPADAVKIAQHEPDKQVVFFAVGFETTTPPTAAILEQAINLDLKNLFIFCNHVLTPPAIKGILEPARLANKSILDGLIGPGHVSVVTGSKPYEALAEDYRVPIAISGFEPLDILQSILMLVRQINAQTHIVENQYTRAVSIEGNLKAQRLIDKYFELCDTFEWRGLGEMPDSAIKIKPAYQHFDAHSHFTLTERKSLDNKACECPAVLTGQKKPTDCKLFNKPCTPENPLGSCMVSSEGACAAYFTYKLHT
jgi:hydrogenase expression/formation protein HypD